jgi:hypothetical protein
MSRTQNPRSIQNLRYWSKGESGNPGGRPRGFVSEIRRQTKNGFELVSFALRVLRNEEAEMRDRAWACTYLTDRGFGKPTQAVELDLHEPTVPVRVIEEAAAFVRKKLDLYAEDGQRGQSESTITENTRMNSGDQNRPVAFESPAQQMRRELLGDPNDERPRA